jgi:Ca2+-binding RTX toxin-like protein
MSAETELVYGRCLQAEGLEVARNFSTGASTVSVKTMMILDDDPTIQFDGTSGAPLSETGSDAILLRGTTFGPVNASRFDPANDNLTYVEVTYIATSGFVGSFRALRFAFGGGNDFYIPRPGSVDLSAVAEVTGYTNLGRGLNGRAWADFGLGQNRIDTVLTDADDTYAGQFVNDHVQAGLGKDLVFGNQGEDLLEGGEDKDTLYGGACDDEIDGGSGKDDLYGGASDDDMAGGEDNDLLDGFWGRDTLAGGDGKDDLFGGADDDTLDGGDGDDALSGDEGADDLVGGKSDDDLSGGAGKDFLDGGKHDDTLDGGNGSDELSGGSGEDRLVDGGGVDILSGGDDADTFVLYADGDTDEITDFEDGLDQIDLGVDFGQLVITDVGPGQVEIAYDGEVLLITDKTGQVTAASFSSADFV